MIHDLAERFSIRMVNSASGEGLKRTKFETDSIRFRRDRILCSLAKDLHEKLSESNSIQQYLHRSSQCYVPGAAGFLTVTQTSSY